MCVVLGLEMVWIVWRVVGELLCCGMVVVGVYGVGVYSLRRCHCGCLLRLYCHMHE